MNILSELFRNRRREIFDWISSYEDPKKMPLYSSVDIRNSGFKSAVVDTNLFPAGFNNLCGTSIDMAVRAFRDAILSRVSGCKRILIVTEEHTRNTWYLENVRILSAIVKQAGFSNKVATFFTEQPPECSQSGFLSMTTAVGQPLRLYCLKYIHDKIAKGEEQFDLIILNNDLSSGIPPLLDTFSMPVFPSKYVGWHSRLKSRHFEFYRQLADSFAKDFSFDPWKITCLFEAVSGISINEANDRQKLADVASDLLRAIQEKYTVHGINERPFIFLKADRGTYGMGVMPIESPQDILDLNRKGRNRLDKGKESIAIRDFILQEGVPSISRFDNVVGESCIYQISNRFVGGFYRLNTQKSDRENLNSSGMLFKKVCHPEWSDELGFQYTKTELSAPVGFQTQCRVDCDSPELSVMETDSGVAPDPHFDVYIVLARLAGIAAHQEILALEQHDR